MAPKCSLLEEKRLALGITQDKQDDSTADWHIRSTITRVSRHECALGVTTG
jgi:hypothetical protein